MDYSSYALKRNPFPRHGSFPLGDQDEEIYALLMVGREEVKEKLDQMLRNLRHGEPSCVTLILGEYGTGKTHCLKYLEYRSRKKYDNIIPIYVKGLAGPGVRYLLKAILDSIEDTLGREFLTKLGKAYLSKGVPQSDVRSFYSALATGKEVIALRWAKGYPLTMKERERLKVTSDVDEHMARDLMASLFRAIWTLLGFKVLVLIDEVEELLKHEEKELMDFYSSLRYLIDTVPEGMMLVLSATPALVKDPRKGVAALSPALMSRLKAEDSLLILRPMEGVDVRRLLTSYLKAFRIPKARGLADTYPFEPDALDLIVRKSEGIPRNALMLANQALREGLTRKKHVIDASFLREVLKIEVEEEQKVVISIGGERGKVAEPKDGKDKKVKVIKLLEQSGGAATFSSLRNRVRMGKEEFMALMKEMEEEGVLELKKVGRGYRVILVEKSAVSGR